MTTVVQSFNLYCRIESLHVNRVGQIEICRAQNLNITARNEEITSVNGRTEPTSLEGILIDYQTVHYLPKGIEIFFPNLKLLMVHHVELKSVTQHDFKSLT